jgi:hypothetical protein
MSMDTCMCKKEEKEGDTHKSVLVVIDIEGIYLTRHSRILTILSHCIVV